MAAVLALEVEAGDQELKLILGYMVNLGSKGG